jgi:3-hydroxyacyl-[acyl-carrier-protein] dehydratase
MLSEINFFKILKLDKIEIGKIRATIRLNAEHEIFAGHFPENPVTPGVASVQMISEILGFYLKKELFLESASNIKYTAMIKPEITPEPIFEIKFEKINENRLKSTATVFKNEIVFLKFSGIFNSL